MLTPTRREPCPFCKTNHNVVQKRPAIQIKRQSPSQKVKIQVAAQVIAKVIDDKTDIMKKIELCQALAKDHYDAVITLEDNGSYLYSVCCLGCNSMGPYSDDIVEAIDYWNNSARTDEQHHQHQRKLFERYLKKLEEKGQEEEESEDETCETTTEE